MNLAGNLKKLRESKGLTQTEVAARIGEGLSYYNKLEKRIMRPSVDVLVRLSRLYGTSIDEIVFLTPGVVKRVGASAKPAAKKSKKAAKPAASKKKAKGKKKK